MTDAIVIIDDIQDSAIIDAEIRPTGEEYPAVALNYDELADVVRIAIATEEGVTSLSVPGEAFWVAALALTRDDTFELEALANGSDSE